MNDHENRAISGALLFQMEHNFISGAVFKSLLDQEVDEIRFHVNLVEFFNSNQICSPVSLVTVVLLLTVI